jgi:hypothetical protein
MDTPQIKSEKDYPQFAAMGLESAGIFVSKKDKFIAIHKAKINLNLGWDTLLGYYDIAAQKCYSKFPGNGNLLITKPPASE